MTLMDKYLLEGMDDQIRQAMDEADKIGHKIDDLASEKQLLERKHGQLREYVLGMMKARKIIRLQHGWTLDYRGDEVPPGKVPDEDPDPDMRALSRKTPWVHLSAAIERKVDP